MKIILSRKGFDSANGGIESPVFSDGTMLSFPIPTEHVERDIRYDELTCKGTSLEKLLADLGYKGENHCHLDPDLVKERRKNQSPDWVPAYGQINQPASYLLNNGISEGDIFLFFGNFRHIECIDGNFRYVRRSGIVSNVYYGRAFQAIWGYLQIGEIVSDPEEQRKLYWHPHSRKESVYGKNNLIFVPSERLSLNVALPGCGVFDYAEKRVLTAPGKNKATWKYNEAYEPGNIKGNRKNSAFEGDGIFYSGIWQELVLKENEKSLRWATALF